MLRGSGKRAGSTLSCVGALRSTTLASITRLPIVASYRVQTAPFTRSRGLDMLGTCGTGTFNDGGARASQALMVMLRLSLSGSLEMLFDMAAVIQSFRRSESTEKVVNMISRLARGGC